MKPKHHRIEANGISAAIDLSVGHIAALEVEVRGRQLAPLHRAPWVDGPDEVLPEDLPPNVRRLSGDFLCAPFGRNDVVAAPTHGWPANSPWTLLSSEGVEDMRSAAYRLDREVLGAKVTKHLRLVDGHPFLYQEHRFAGGEGLLSVSHHVMTRVERDARLAVSPKRGAWTMDTPLESDSARGSFALSYPAEAADLARFPLRDGTTCDLRRFPVAASGEDFVILDETAASGLGWTIVNRVEERDALILLKDAAELPATMLWMSHGGRTYAPWNGRHTGVIGIEDCRASPYGHAASVAGGEATAIRLDAQRTRAIHLAVGAWVSPGDGDFWVDLAVGDAAIHLVSARGLRQAVPFDTSFLGLSVDRVGRG